ncbi:MAG TPA: hypothetical protein VEL10_09755 [Gaiellaceae bacterium]|nr:hypothetical protein [Gaiellaceae bacterium]
MTTIPSAAHFNATPAIIESFDPGHVTKSNPSGYAYEAYFLEARPAS